MIFFFSTFAVQEFFFGNCPTPPPPPLKNKMVRPQSQSSRSNAKLLFQVMFSLPLPSLHRETWRVVTEDDHRAFSLVEISGLPVCIACGPDLKLGSRLLAMASRTRILCAASFGILGALQLLLIFYFHPKSKELSRKNCYGKCSFCCLCLMRV